jgi:hypothetical protein
VLRTAWASICRISSLVGACGRLYFCSAITKLLY